MTQQEKYLKMIDSCEAAKDQIDDRSWYVSLLACIAESLAIIADKMNKENEMVDEVDPLDRGGNDGCFSGHAADHGSSRDQNGSSRDQNVSDVAFWGN